MKVAALVAASFAAVCTADPCVVDEQNKTTYHGIERNGIEVFLGIPYAQDTSGANRFKPPKPVEYQYSKTIEAKEPGPDCPQSLGQWLPPLTLGNITEVSEDCLKLNVARPKGSNKDSRYGVMVWIHGGSFWTGSKDEITTLPDGMILQSIENGYPIVHIALNYRLGAFGFAQSEALKKEGSENAGLKDQRLAIEWVRDNIVNFGGDPNRITIFGQSSGGLAVGLQALAYGGEKGLPFQQGICQSQALEPGITGNFTINAMKDLVDYAGCNKTYLHSEETIECLRELDTETFFNASFDTYQSDIAHNIGDIWLPVVDGDFLPAPPSKLIRSMNKTILGETPTYIFGWTDSDVTFFTDPSIATANDTFDFVSKYLPNLPTPLASKLLSLYPVQEFAPLPGTNLTAEFYRSARIFRDIIMVCPAIFYQQWGVYRWMENTYSYDWNQTILDPILASPASANISEFGPVHTSEFAYIFGNFSHYNVSGYPLHPSDLDYTIQRQSSRSWTTFANIGVPDDPAKDTLRWNAVGRRTTFQVIGGLSPGPRIIVPESPGKNATAQDLYERCRFLNSDEVIGYLGF